MTSVTEKTLSRYILTLGELVQLSYSRINKKLFLLLQCIVFFKVLLNIESY